MKIPHGWSGRSFLALWQGHRLENPRHELVLTHGLHTRQRAVFDGRWLYIRTYHPGYFEYPPQMLFDLREDPHQTKNLAQESPVRLHQMDEQLRAWEGENIAKTHGADPLRAVQVTPPQLGGTLNDYVQRLRKQGRTADAERLLQRWQHIERDYSPSHHVH